MPKKCIICNEEAAYKIKDTPDFYCEECAKENFADLDMLVKVEEEAQRLKKVLQEKMDELIKEEDRLKQLVKENDEITESNPNRED